MKLCIRKKLTRTDVMYKMSWPIKHLIHLEEKQLINLNNPAHKVEFQVVDQDDHTWSFLCTSRTNGHKKPAISGQWLHFVKFHNLQVADDVVFLFNHPDDGVPFRVCFQKQGAWACSLYICFVQSVYNLNLITLIIHDEVKINKFWRMKKKV